jgi:ABC-type multidrug transport system fused ATPase/permease subunit
LKAILFHSSQILRLLKSLNIRKKLALSVLCPYYLVTIFNALLEGIGMLLLVNIFTGGLVKNDENGLMSIIVDTIKVLGINPQFPDITPILIGLFSINLVTRFSLLSFTGFMTAFLRRRIQETVFKHYLRGDWSHMRNFRVGDAVGTNTQESVISGKYLIAVTDTIYFFLSALVMACLALSASLEISLALGVIALPLIWLMNKIVKAMSDIFKIFAEVRNEFSSDIADRFNGLLQVHVDGNYDFHIQEGLKVQSRLTYLEILSAFCQGAIGSFNVLLPLTVLISFSIWSFFTGETVTNLTLIASVGVLGLRVASQLNGAIVALGNLARLSGSLYPLFKALDIPPICTRRKIDEPIARIEVTQVSYTYNSNKVIEGATFKAVKGLPLVLSGPSGKGKTTLANLLAGLYFPSTGKVTYIAESGTEFLSTNYRPQVGFVTQDIYLFKASLRSNLVSDRNCTDEQIWTALEQVDAGKFVRALGGLDAESAEAGRSLSGGQRRRLGIARVLLSGSKILIFDEVTAGLDSTNKASVLNLIERLSKNFIIVVISHEKLSFSRHATHLV